MPEFHNFIQKFYPMDLSGTEHEAEGLSEELPMDTENTFRDFSSTEDAHVFSEESFSSIGDSSFSFSCMSSIRECEEYFETGTNGDAKGSFVDFISSYNHTTEHHSSKMYSDDSTKRYKTSTESQSFGADMEEDTSDNFLCTEHGTSPANSLDENSLMDSDGLSNQQVSHLQQETRRFHACTMDREEQTVCSAIGHHVDSEVFLDQENVKNVDLDPSIGAFGEMMCHESPGILKCCQRPSCVGSQDSTLDQIDSGFVTGNNKKIFMDPSKIILVDEDINDDSKMQTFSPTVSNDCSRSMGMPERSAGEIPIINGKNPYATYSRSSCFIGAKNANPSPCMPVHSERMPVLGESHRQSCEDDGDTRMVEIFRNVQKYFKNHEHVWVFEQFKWTWLHFFSIQMHESECLESEIIGMMNLRLKNEHSVLRRIVEFDDVPFRFMVLGIIRIDRDGVELYDGFYSLRFEIDKSIRTMLKIEQCDIGSRLYVFGCDILLEKPTSIFDVKGNALRLHYNSIRVCNDAVRLGAMRKASFLNSISRLILNGGVVSAVVVKIKRIIELKYFVAVENYRNRVDDIEQEMEKIHEIARRVDYVIDPEDVAVRRFCKMVVEDESGECTLTWWSPPELKTGETYKLIYLIPVRNSSSLHLSTSRKTYFEKMG